MSVRTCGALAAAAFLFLTASPAAAKAVRHIQVGQFERDLRQLASLLDIPGMSFVVVENGKTVAIRQFGIQRGADRNPFSADTPLRIASVTKAFSAIAALQLAEEGKLNLHAPAKLYDPTLNLPDDVSVRHILTHTSEGLPGGGFVYGTTRYSRLGPILSAADGRPFDVVLRNRVAERAGMRWHPSKGVGAHAALVSTVKDMGFFAAALDQGKLLSPSALAVLASPSRSRSGRALPVSLGWFAQDVQGLPVMWSFGQDDPEHSGALLLRIPEKKITLFLMANSNLVSDPFRLLAGDVRKSPFAMSFLRNFALSDPKSPAPPLPQSAEAMPAWLTSHEQRGGYSYADEIFGSALVDAWRGHKRSAETKIKLALDRYSPAPDPVLHFVIMQFELDALRPNAITWGRELLAEQPQNRWLLLAQGYLLQRSGDVAGASRQFETILALPNQEPDSLHLLFKNWSWLALAELHKKDVPRARSYLQQAIDSGVKGPTLERAQSAMAALGG